MPTLPVRILLAPAVLALMVDTAPDPARQAMPPPSPAMARPQGAVLFSDDFSDPALPGWEADRDGIWRVRRGVLRAELPDLRQQRSFLYAGSAGWGDVAVDLDVCGMRGVDKGVMVRVDGEVGVGVDLRGPGYQDVVMYRREWSLGKARVVNPNGVWNHLRIEAVGARYRVFVDDKLMIDRVDARGAGRRGRIALAAYTGGVGQCTVYYDNVVVTALDSITESAIH